MMHKNDIYEYAVLRLVPRVDREEFINVGVLLLCRKQKFASIKYVLDNKRCVALFPDIDVELIQNQIRLFDIICQGKKEGGLIASLELHERFRWLTANRSTMLQCSPVHIGLTENASDTLNQLFEDIVI